MNSHSSPQQIPWERNQNLPKIIISNQNDKEDFVVTLWRFLASPSPPQTAYNRLLMFGRVFHTYVYYVGDPDPNVIYFMCALQQLTSDAVDNATTSEINALSSSLHPKHSSYSVC